MRIFNEDKTQEIESFDEKLYYLKPDKLFIKHHEAVEEVQQKSHYEVVRTNEKTGGVEYKEVIDVEHQSAKEAYDEYEDIQVIVPYSEKQLNQFRLSELEYWFDDYFDKQLNQSLWQDDFAVSHDDYFDKDYAGIDELKAQAKIVRDEIRELREKIK